MRWPLAALALLASAAPAQRPTSAERQAADTVRRIGQLDRKGPKLGAVIALTPDWRAQARTIDRQPVTGPLHGRPILIKDNIETRELPTTAGSLALAGNRTGQDAPLVARLRGAGALILGKTNLSEWANFRSTRSISGWSATGGIVRNPYALDRTACGSSSGSAVAVAAGLAWGAIGSETDGSITCPASMNGVVGLKSTQGLISGAGIVPLSHSQDTAGPIARTVRDVAELLGVIAEGPHRVDYATGLGAGLKGVRIGVLRRVGPNPAMPPLFDAAIEKLRAAGAELVDIPDFPQPAGLGDAETIILLTDFKVDLDAYLAKAPSAVTPRDLAALIAFNDANRAREMPYFGQELFVQAQATKGLDDPAYRAAKTKAAGAGNTLDTLFAKYRVAMIVQPTTGPAYPINPVQGDKGEGPSASQLPAMSGYPHLTVPMAQIQGLPVGLSFIGPKWSEAALLAAGAAFETQRGPLPGPTYRATVPVD
ncbi:MAG TPA: amidase [Sphingomonas sp.]|nr:amidase [Sphingomonas sp.]